jgi:hypothetical protein
MKATSNIILAAFFTWFLVGTKVNGQVVATGHVTAEVIEAVSAASATISSFELGKASAFNGVSSSSESINLGSITINSGKDIACNVVLKSAALTDSAGNGFTIEPTVKNNLYAAATQPNGSQTIQLGGTTTRESSLASGLYEGSYTVVFAYN